MNEETGTPQPNEWTQKRWLVVVLFLVPAAVGFLVYWGSLGNEFVWDDPIVLGQQLQAFHSIKDIFFPPPKIPQFGHLYYRPLISLSYVIDRWLWGDTPFGFHFPVVLFHALNSGLIFLVGRRLFGATTGGLMAALGASLLFATHPIHTESVCWMAGRSDTMAAMFLLPAFLAYLAWKQDRSRRIYLGLAGGLFLIGCLAKESALGLLFIVLAADLFGIMPAGRGDGEGEPGLSGSQRSRSAESGRSGPGTPPKDGASGRRRTSTPRPSNKATRQTNVNRPWFSHIVGWATLGACTAIYFLMRTSALAAEGDPLRRQEPDPLVSVQNLLRAVGFYLSKLVIPTHLDAYIPIIPNPGLCLALGVVGLLVSAALVWLALRMGERMSAFLLVWLFGALAPSLAIAFYQISEAPVAERYLYLPSAAFCLLLGYVAFLKIPAVLGGAGGRTALLCACTGTLLLAAVYGNATIARGKVWRTDLDFWHDGVAKSPNEGLPHLHLGLAYANKQEDVLAEKEYLLAIDPKIDYDVEGRSTALNNLGMLYMGRQNYERADECFHRAIEMRPDYPTPHYGLGVTALRRAERASGQTSSSEYVRQAELELHRAIDLNPQYVKAHNQLAYLLANSRREAEALQHIDRVLKLVSRGNEYEFALRLRATLAARGQAGVPGAAPR